MLATQPHRPFQKTIQGLKNYKFEEETDWLIGVKLARVKSTSIDVYGEGGIGISPPSLDGTCFQGSSGFLSDQQLLTQYSGIRSDYPNIGKK